MSNPRSTNGQLKIFARDRAYQDLYTQMYKHQMRYQPREVQELLDLDDQDIEYIESFNIMQEKQNLPLRQVTVGLPADDFDDHQEVYKTKALKAARKCYIGKCLVTFELGESGKHPHYNFLFEKIPEWLARSRIITEFANTFKVAKNYVDVKEKNAEAWSSIESYICKEGIWSYTNYTENSKKKKK